jgi:hypothetical protein
MASHPCLLRPWVCASLELIARARRSSSSTWLLPSRGSLCRFLPPCSRWITFFARHDRYSFLFSLFHPSSLRPDDRSKQHAPYFSACLLLSRCVSRGTLLSKKMNKLSVSSPQEKIRGMQDIVQHCLSLLNSSGKVLGPRCCINRRENTGKM